MEIILAGIALYLVFNTGNDQRRQTKKKHTNSAKAKSTTTNSGGLKNG